MGRIALFLTIFALTAGFDQASKEWARSSLVVHAPKPVIAGFWDWELALNPGAAFSAFAGSGAATQIILSIVALLALVGIGIMAARTAPEQRLLRFALAMIGGGALGNLIDRVRDGAVTDFVRWRWHEHAWPIFNVADAALLIGALLLIVDTLLGQRRRRQPA
ncbi:MAG: signal peptidase II [Myxococcota bacterium]|nr:signal peptidase II [Myxococcota bacterium]